MSTMHLIKSVESVSYSGDVTSLAIVPGPFTASEECTALLLAGIGSQVHVFANPSGRLLTQPFTALPNSIRVHGISVADTSVTSNLPEPTSSSSKTYRNDAVFAVHGDRYVAVFQLFIIKDALGGHSVDNECSIVPLVQLPRLPYWTMDVHLQWDVDTFSGNVAVGLSDNSLEIHALELSSLSSSAEGERNVCCSSRCIQRIENTERCLLYSMHLQPLPYTNQNNAKHQHQQRQKDRVQQRCHYPNYIVAGGTVYLDIVIWATLPLNTVAAPSDNLNDSVKNQVSIQCAPLLYKLTGHEGAIHRVRWARVHEVQTQPLSTATSSSNDKDDNLHMVLASASDDRTIRIWNIPIQSQLQPQTKDDSQHLSINTKSTSTTDLINDMIEQSSSSKTSGSPVVPEHVLYGHTARLWDLSFSPGLIASCSEDCTFKFWDLRNGKCLRTVQAHRGRGVWRCALHAGLFFTGGNDAGVKVWNLLDWLPATVLTSFPAGDKTLNLHNTDNSRDKDSSEENEGGTCCQRYHGALALTLPNPATSAVGDVFVVKPGQTSEVQIESESKYHQGLISLEESEARNVDWVKPANSRSEWVRSMVLNQDGSVLYVATNRGLVHQVVLPGPGIGPERWTTIYVATKPSPLGTLRIMEMKTRTAAGLNGTTNLHYLGVCDKDGKALVIQCPYTRNSDNGNSRQAAVATGEGSSYIWEWQPFTSPSTLDIFFAPKLATVENTILVFTGALDGIITLWKLPPPTIVHLGAVGGGDIVAPVRLAEIRPEMKLQRAVALDAVWIQSSQLQENNDESNIVKEGVVVVGSSCGGVAALYLSLPLSTLVAEKTENIGKMASNDITRGKLSVLAWSSKVHDITPVRLVKIISAPPPTILQFLETRLQKPQPLERIARVITAGSDNSVIQFNITLSTPDNNNKSSSNRTPSGQLVKCREERFESITTIDGDTANCSVAASGWSGLPRVIYGFQGLDFVAVSVGDDCEVTRVRCEGWRRPHAFSVRGVDEVTLCYLKAGDIVVYRQPGVWLDSPHPVEDQIQPRRRSLHHALHAREVNTAALFSFNNSSSSLVCLTGGEDSGLRCTTAAASCLVGTAAAGTAIKTISVLPLANNIHNNANGSKEGNDHWLVVSGGARQVLMAWHIWKEPAATSVSTSSPSSSEQKERLEHESFLRNESEMVIHHEQLHVQLPRKGLKQKSTSKGKSQASAELRYMSLSTFLPPIPIITNTSNTPSPALPAVAFVVASTSDGIVSLLACHLTSNYRCPPLAQQAQHAWPVVALLDCHTPGVVMCLDVQEVVLRDGSRRSVAVTGSSSGGVMVWDLTDAALSYVNHYSKSLNVNIKSSTDGNGDGYNSTTRAVFEEKKGAGQDTRTTRAPIVLQPLLSIEGWHQSGVNSMSTALLPISSTPDTTPKESTALGGQVHGDAEIFLVTGGDDQALHTAVLKFLPTSHNNNSSSDTNSSMDGNGEGDDCMRRCECILVQHSLLLNAHSSAVRGVWTDARIAISVGLDQRVRIWKVDLSLLSLLSLDLDTCTLTTEESSAGSNGEKGVLYAERDMLCEMGCQVTQVIEPGALSVAVAIGAGTDVKKKDSEEESVYHICIGGRGVELMKLTI